MILENAYDYRIFKSINLSNIKQNINKYITIDYGFIKGIEKIKLDSFSNTYIKLNPVILYGLTDIEKDIAAFNHSIINKENKWIALDLRQTVIPTSDKESYTIRNDSEYNTAIQRFILSGMWAVEKYSDIYGLKFPHFVFGNWLSENISRRFGLDLNTQIQLKILALIYYSKLFTNDYTTDDFNKLIIRLKDDIIVYNIIEEIYSKIDKLENIDDFCRCCYLVTNNIRLKDFDFNVLINILSNNWIGLNAKEYIALSLEHPPTWISLVYAGLTHKSFNKSFIANIINKTNKKGSGDEFLKSLISITKEYKLDK